jgi:short-subunit dehydrogenase
MISLKGKWTLVTGASRGVGSHVSEGLARLGSHVVLHSREQSHTRTLAAKLAGLGVKIRGISRLKISGKVLR